jgi:hypothetical protein
MVTTPTSISPFPGSPSSGISPNAGNPPVLSDMPVLTLSLKTFGLGGAPNPPSTPIFNTGVNNDVFQKNAIAMGGNLQQQLQAAYQDAERSRNNYLQLANLINSQAYQNQLSNNNLVAPPGGGAGQPNGFQPFIANPNQAQQQMQQMQQQLQQQQQAALAAQQQAAEQARLQAEQQLQMQQAQEAAAAQQNMPQMPPAQQPQAPPQMPQAAAMEPAQELQQPGQEEQEPDRPLKKASIEELNSMLAQSQNVQDKLNAMAELAHPQRRVGNAATYELLKREAAADTSAIPPGPQKQQADELRKDALLTLGILNAAQNAVGPTDRLPGIDVIDQVLSDPKTDPSVKIAGIQALQTINRPDDPLIRKILEKAQKDGNPDVKTRAQSALAGEAIPLPS